MINNDPKNNLIHCLVVALGAESIDVDPLPAALERIRELRAAENELRNIQKLSGFEESPDNPTTPRPTPRQNLIDLEMEIGQLISNRMADGLTVTEICGTLFLLAGMIQSQFQNSITHSNG